MSFTTSVKQELNRVPRARRCCQTAELAALFRAAGSLTIHGRGGYSLSASFGLSATARTVLSLVRSFDLPTEVRVIEERRLGPHRRYEVHLEGGARLVQFLEEVGVLSDRLSLQERIPRRIISRRCCRASFLRGAFIAAGSVSEPGGPAHLEIYSHNEAFLLTIIEADDDLGLPPLSLARRRHPAVYAKRLPAISEFLVATGAHRAALEFEERTLISRVRESANRRANCDQANAARASTAAARQVRAIRSLRSSGRLEGLSAGLRYIAELREMHPSATIGELGSHASPHLGRSAVNHRLRRLVALAGQ